MRRLYRRILCGHVIGRVLDVYSNDPRGHLNTSQEQRVRIPAAVWPHQVWPNNAARSELAQELVGGGFVFRRPPKNGEK